MMAYSILITDRCLLNNVFDSIYSFIHSTSAHVPITSCKDFAIACLFCH